MNRSSLRLPRFGSVIALIALFVALGGPAEAARLISGKDIKKNSITAKQVKQRSLRGTDLRQGTLTGKEINESKLGSVPRAEVAARAQAADTLGGTPASGFATPASLAPGPFQAATLENGWTDDSDFSPVGWFVDAGGIVHLQGLADVGTVPDTVFTLPAGLRPAKIKAFSPLCANAAGYLEVEVSGSVYVSNQPGSNCSAFVSFEGITFRPGT